jgi:hypothetical protein
MTVPLGKGNVSLGCLRPSSRPTVFLDKRGKVRARLLHGNRTLEIPVTDIRLVREDHETIRTQRLEWLNRSMGTEAVLAVGLSRPFKGGSRSTEEHWLQINNVHPASDPLWASAPE